MDLDILKAELQDAAYAGLSDQAAADALNLVDGSIERNKDSVSGSDIFRNVDGTEFAALTTDEKRDALALCALDNVDPFGPAASIIAAIFGGGSTTITTLAAFRKEDISRATELGLGVVTGGYVKEARRLP